MMLKIPTRFILVDDDYVNNLLSSIVIEGVAGEVEIKAFEDTEEALEYIGQQDADETGQIILFLDINMPVYSGWDFLDSFEKLSEKIKDQFRIYMLSSSLDAGDRQRALENKDVIDYIEKPLCDEVILSILATFNETA